MIATLDYSSKIFREMELDLVPKSAHWGRVTHICIIKKISLVQIMACRLFGTKPLSEPVLEFVNWNLRKQLQRNLKRNFYIFIHEYAFENVVCKMAGILSRPQCVHVCQVWWGIPTTELSSAINLSTYTPHTHIDLCQIFFVKVTWDYNESMPFFVNTIWQVIFLICINGVICILGNHFTN